MKQIFTNIGHISICDVPEPTLKKGFIKIKVHYSCISAGTEISTIKGSSKSILNRVLEDPSKVSQVVKIAKDQGIRGVKNKLNSINEKLGTVGYSISGEVIDVGDNVENIRVGDLVAAGGGGYAVHAEVVVVPKNLVVKVPVGVDLIPASLGTVGAIALHGVRRANLALGEYGVVFGVGLIGMLAVQILKASGVKVACIDINAERLNISKVLGADKIIDATVEDPVLAIQNWSAGYGADAILFTATTIEDKPLSQAFNMCRRKGKVVLIGVSGMNIDRNDIYKNEIDLLISTSYGPGRYDNNYEIEGNDYPYAYVRWTENRNIESFLNLIKEGKVSIDKMTSKIYSYDNADVAYDNVQSSPNDHIITILDYGRTNIETAVRAPIIVNDHLPLKNNRICLGLIGSGSFAENVLLPIIKENGSKFYLKTIVNRTGDKALNIARQFKAEKTSSNTDDIFKDPEIDLVVICTRHNDHAELVMNSLRHNKNVFVEKPLATNYQELHEIEGYFENNAEEKKPLLMVGFNRRFSIYAKEIKSAIVNRDSPLFLRYRMNAGYAHIDEWVHKDGGRIVGEACHIIDLMQYLVGSEIVDMSVCTIEPRKGRFISSDNRSISLCFKDGSLAVIDYFSCGNHNLSKEYMEVHFENKSIILDDYRSITGYGIKIKSHKSSIPKKGHKEEWLALFEGLKEGKNPIKLESLFETTKISLLASK